MTFNMAKMTFNVAKMMLLKRKWRRNWLIFGGDGVFHVENCNFRCGNGVYCGGMACLDKNGVFLAQMAPFMTKMAPCDGNGASLLKWRLTTEMAPHRRKWRLTGGNGASRMDMVPCILRTLLHGADVGVGRNCQ